MEERRRDSRIDVELPFRVDDPAGASEWSGRSVDVSPTGLLLRIDAESPPPAGAIVTVAVQGPAESGWEHINRRTMRVVRVKGGHTGLTYVDLDSV